MSGAGSDALVVDDVMLVDGLSASPMEAATTAEDEGPLSFISSDMCELESLLDRMIAGP